MLKDRIVLLFCAFFLLAASVTLTNPGTATAATCPRMTECAYYSDSTYTVLVGEYFRNCGGGVYSWGSTTGYKRCVYEPCGGC